MSGRELYHVKVSVVDLPAFRIMAEAIYAIGSLEEYEMHRAPEIAREAARDAVAIVQEQRRA